MEQVNPKDIKKHPNFETLFAIKPEVLARIEEGMKGASKYDFSQPVILAQWEGQKEPVCIDGHTRIQAAINAGLQSVPVFIHEDLESEEEAKLIAVKLQCNRRNLSDGELMTFLEMLDTPNKQMRDQSTGQFTVAQDCALGKSAAAIAKTLNTSVRKAEQMLTVKHHAQPEVYEAVKQDKISVNKAYQETQKRRRAAKVAEDTVEPTSPNTSSSTSDVSGATPNSACKETAKLADTCVDGIDGMTITLKPDQYRALRDLGDSIEYHVELAIDVYLRMVADEVEEDENEERMKVTQEDS